MRHKTGNESCSHRSRPKTTHLGNPIPIGGGGYKVDRKLVLQLNDFLREHQHLLVWPYTLIMLGGDSNEE